MAMHFTASNDAILLAAINQFNAQVPIRVVWNYTNWKVTKKHNLPQVLLGIKIGREMILDP